MEGDGKRGKRVGGWKGAGTGKVMLATEAKSQSEPLTTIYVTEEMTTSFLQFLEYSWSLAEKVLWSPPAGLK